LIHSAFLKGTDKMPRRKALINPSFRRFFFSITALLWLGTSGCQTRTFQDPASPSDPKAMGQNDWFRRGTDRFYLASFATDKKIDPDYPVFKGNELMLGVGCHQEDNDPKSTVTINEPRSDGTVHKLEKRLYERRYVHEFPWAEDKKKPKRGECEVLLGDPNNRLVVSNSFHNFTKGDKGKVVLQGTFTATSCVGAMFSLGSFLGGLSSGGAGVGMPMLTWWVASGTWFCGLNLKNMYESVEGYKSQENRNLFYRAMKEAEILTDARLFGMEVEQVRARSQTATSGGQMNSLAKGMALPEDLKCQAKSHHFCMPYLKAVNEKNWRVTSALYTQLFVQTFNSQVYETFEQGWPADVRNKRFFEAVRSVQTELASAHERNFKALPSVKSEGILISPNTIQEETPANP
jgi:hypothetical protein